jgi:hypothetical protein
VGRTEVHRLFGTPSFSFGLMNNIRQQNKQ